MTATASSNLPVTFTVTSGNSVVEVNGTMLKVLGSGAPPYRLPKRRRSVCGRSHGGQERHRHQGQPDHRDQCEPGELAEPDQGFRRLRVHSSDQVGQGGHHHFDRSCRQLREQQLQRGPSHRRGARLKLVGGGTATITASQPETPDTMRPPPSNSRSRSRSTALTAIRCPAWSFGWTPTASTGTVCRKR